MATPAQLDALIQRLQELKEGGEGDEGAPEEIPDADVTKAIVETARPVHQAIFSGGYAKGKSEEEKFQDELAEKQAELDALKKKMADLEEEKPDLAKLREEQEAQLDQLRTEKKEREEELQSLIGKERRERAHSDLISHLVSEHGVDRVYAKALVRDEEVAGRLRWTEDGKLEVLQKGTENIPMAPEDGTNPLALLATELESEVPAHLKGGPGDRGSETRGEGGGGGGAGSDWAKRREKLEKERKKESENRRGNLAEEYQKRGA